MNFKFFDHHKNNSELRYDSDLSVKELWVNNEGFLAYIVANNEKFFTDHHAECLHYVKLKVVENKVVRPEWLGEDTFLNYLVLLFTKSFLSLSVYKPDSSYVVGYIERRQIIKNFERMALVLYLNSNLVTVTRILKGWVGLLDVSTLVDRYIERSVRVHEFGSLDHRTPVSTTKYRFRIDYTIPFKARVTLHIALTPFQPLLGYFIIGSSIETLNCIFKKSLAQKTLNKGPIDLITKASSKPLTLDSRLKPLFNKEFNQFFNYCDPHTKYRNLSLELMDEQKNLAKLYKVAGQGIKILMHLSKQPLKSENLTQEVDILVSYFSFLTKNEICGGVDLVLQTDVTKSDKLTKGSGVSIQQVVKRFRAYKHQIDERRLKISNLSKERDTALNFIYIHHLFTLNIKTFYLSYYYDFRLRIYSKSPVGPTLNKLVRSFIIIDVNEYDYTGTLDSHMAKVYLNQVVVTKNAVIKCLKLNGGDINYRLKLLLGVIYLIELGKIHKTKLLGDGISVTVDGFITEGLKLYKTSDFGEIESADRIHIKKFQLAIKAVIGNDFRPWGIEQDSTCSSFLH